jgi:hypothetical protein
MAQLPGFGVSLTFREMNQVQVRATKPLIQDYFSRRWARTGERLHARILDMFHDYDMLSGLGCTDQLPEGSLVDIPAALSKRLQSWARNSSIVRDAHQPFFSRSGFLIPLIRFRAAMKRLANTCHLRQAAGMFKRQSEYVVRSDP